MQRILITGLSGTGKSSLIRALAALGYRAVDTDDDWPRWVTPVPDPESDDPDAPPDWIWREGLVGDLLADEDGDVLFVSGCRTNQRTFYGRFDEIVLLTAPPAVIARRLRTRTTNDYGRDPGELERVLDQVRTVEPRLRASATVVIDTRAPLAEVVDRVVGLVARHDATH